MSPPPVTQSMRPSSRLSSARQQAKTDAQSKKSGSPQKGFKPINNQPKVVLSPLPTQQLPKQSKTTKKKGTVNQKDVKTTGNPNIIRHPRVTDYPANIQAMFDQLVAHYLTASQVVNESIILALIASDPRTYGTLTDIAALYSITAQDRRFYDMMVGMYRAGRLRVPSGYSSPGLIHDKGQADRDEVAAAVAKIEQGN